MVDTIDQGSIVDLDGPHHLRDIGLHYQRLDRKSSRILTSPVEAVLFFQAEDQGEGHGVPKSVGSTGSFRRTWPVDRMNHQRSGWLVISPGGCPRVGHVAAATHSIL